MRACSLGARHTFFGLMFGLLIGSVALAQDAQPVDVFNGQNLDGWSVKGDQARSKWTVGKAIVSPTDPKLLQAEPGTGEMINLAQKHADSFDIYSQAKFGDCHIELEVMVPQGSNSGIYVMGEYEIQVLDSFGVEKPGTGDMGGIYGAAPPRVNACKKPGEWQKYVIDFQAPKFDAQGKKVANAKFIKVELNGQVLQENVEMQDFTGGPLEEKESPTGPIMFQGNHGAVAYRNIRITPLGK